jgi:hypothetical protein
MKSTALSLCFAMLLALAAGTAASFGQSVLAQAPSSVSYLSPGRYLIFQGTYPDNDGKAESGLIKFDSQTGMAWLLRPAPKSAESATGFCWEPVKN